jgi:aspartyl-tRNA(Asn)/glutamyl-tRNA(Gln) amidotransferase subunit B
MSSHVSSRLIRQIGCSGHASQRELRYCCRNAIVSQSRALQGEATPARPTEPIRKQLRYEAKQKRLAAKSSPLEFSRSVSATEGKWELTVGIEVHAELDTGRKLFSTAGTSVNDTPNSNVALCDLGYPGAQPLFQPATLLPALRAALALGCDIQQKSSFDRKHYFYQDQPSGYQITQYYGLPHIFHSCRVFES